MRAVGSLTQACEHTGSEGGRRARQDAGSHGFRHWRAKHQHDLARNGSHAQPCGKGHHSLQPPCRGPEAQHQQRRDPDRAERQRQGQQDTRVGMEPQDGHANEQPRRQEREARCRQPAAGDRPAVVQAVDQVMADGGRQALQARCRQSQACAKPAGERHRTPGTAERLRVRQAEGQEIHRRGNVARAQHARKAGRSRAGCARLRRPTGVLSAD